MASLNYVGGFHIALSVTLPLFTLAFSRALSRPGACVFAQQSLRRQHKEVGSFRFPNKSKFNTFSEHTKVRTNSRMSRHSPSNETQESDTRNQLWRYPHSSTPVGTLCVLLYLSHTTVRAISRSLALMFYRRPRPSSPHPRDIFTQHTTCPMCLLPYLYLAFSQERRRTGFDEFLRLVVSCCDWRGVRNHEYARTNAR